VRRSLFAANGCPTLPPDGDGGRLSREEKWDTVRILFLDTETFSEVPITDGTYKYAENAEVLLSAWAVDDGPVVVCDVTEDPENALINLSLVVSQADVVVMHNSMFDRNVLKHNGVDVPVERIYDTMVRALAHSLPAALGALCDVLEVPTDKAKDKAGKKLIQLFTKPRPKNVKLRRATRETNPEEWAAFIEYARLDVEAMREVFKRLPRWNSTPSEYALWRLDQKINDRGIAIDLELAAAAMRAADRTAADLAVRSSEMTGGVVTSLTQRAKLLEYLATVHRVRLEDLRKGTVRALLEKKLKPEVRTLLEARQQASATSPAKYSVLLKGTSADGRLRGTLQFCGASRTLRWSGRLFQPQNLPRPTMKAHVIANGIAAMKLDCEDLIFENVMELCSNAVRGALIAPPGRKLVISDLSNIEGRVLAWIAGEDWKVKAFKDYDLGIGHDIYVLAFAKAFGVPIEEVVADYETGDGKMRQLGKIMELALGYQGSVGAFNTMARLYGVEMPDEAILILVRAFRKSNRAIVSLWYDLELAARQALHNPQETRRVGLLELGMLDGWLRIRLPSGHYLSYPGFREDAETKELFYLGNNQYTKKWEELQVYGGKFSENATQAVARDVLAHGMLDAEVAGYEICLHVHDELITEVPDTDAHTPEGLSAIMAASPGWSLGLPLAAKGFQTNRYEKG
jgi:DNA polymerase